MDSIVSPKYSKKVEGEGMPIYKSGTREEPKEMEKGNLYVKFDIKFPSTLT